MGASVKAPGSRREEKGQNLECRKRAYWPRPIGLKRGGAEKCPCHGIAPEICGCIH